MERTTITRVAAVLAVSAGLWSAYVFVVRPWHRTWGSVPAEAHAVLPGDELVPAASAERGTTHAITIHAPVDAVWPWIAQLGQDRGGFYSFEVLEDLVGAQMTNVYQLLPNREQWRVGDKLWMYPPERLHGMGHAVLGRLEPGRVLAFATRSPASEPDSAFDGSWSFILQPMEGDETRLLIRSRAPRESSLLGQAFTVSVFEPMHFTMERKMMENISALSEGHHVSLLQDNLQPLLWTIVVGLGVFALVLVFRRQSLREPLLSFVTAGVVFQWLTFGQPALWLGTLVVGVLGSAVWNAYRMAPRGYHFEPHAPGPVLSPKSQH